MTQDVAIQTAPRGKVSVEGAGVSYRARDGHLVQALQPTNLKLEPGSFTSLIGPSGCGKSTLLNALAGFVGLTDGVIIVDNKMVSEPAPEIGVVFQQYALFPWFTAAGNIEFALRRLDLSRAERRRQAIEALDEVGLSGRADSYPSQLSGGMKQRVALARTLAGRPKVLLMDEPFGALDAQTRMSMHELLLKVWDARRTTVLFVTHDVDEALILSDRIHVMSASPGRIVETIEVTSARPRTVDHVDATYLSNRNRIMHLLHRDAVKED